MSNVPEVGSEGGSSPSLSGPTTSLKTEVHINAHSILQLAYSKESRLYDQETTYHHQ